MIKIGSASIDEKGGIKGGATGDQTTKEIRIQTWYDSPWTHYLEFPDVSVAEKAAAYMEDICLDNNFGYDQGERLSGYYSIKANGGKVEGAKGEFDCSSLVSSCYNLAGVNVSPNNSTFSMVDAFTKAGFKVYTDAAHLRSPDLATRGGVYLNASRHVVMALEDGAGIKKLEPAKKKNWVEIITNSGLEKQNEWLPAIKHCATDKEYKNSILRFLPQLIEKIGNKKG